MKRVGTAEAETKAKGQAAQRGDKECGLVHSASAGGVVNGLVIKDTPAH